MNEGRQRARALREEVGRSEAGFLVDGAHVDRLQLNHDAACVKLAEAARLDPDNAQIAIELGDLWILRGSLAEGEKAFAAARAAAARTGEPRDLSASHDKIGDVQSAQGDLAGGADQLSGGLAIADRLARADPGNAGWRRDLSVSTTRSATCRVAQGNLPAALTSPIRPPRDQRPTGEGGPGNAGWQRDLSVSHNKSATCRSRRAICRRR